MIAIGFFVIFIAVMSLGAEQTPPVELLLSTPRAAYVIGDPIPVTLQIRARDTSQVLEYGDKCFSKFYMHLTVMNPDGLELFYKTKRDGHGGTSRKEGWVTVAKSGTVVRDTDLTDVYNNETRAWSSKPHSLTFTGVYHVIYSDVVQVRPVGLESNLWVGAVTSAPLAIRIMPVDNDSLRAARRVLSKTNTELSLQLRALTKLQYSTAKLTTEDYNLLQKLLMRDDVTIDWKIIRVLSAKPSAEGFKVLSDLLATEKDYYTLSAAIAALEYFNTPAAHKLVLEECKSRTNAYRTAVFVLGKVGDESCLGVLHEIARTDTNDLVHGQAIESIKKIEERMSAPKAKPVNEKEDANTE